jgi:imidazolonepropionase
VGAPEAEEEAARLAVELGARSLDHASGSPAAIAALAGSDVTAVLTPATSLLARGAPRSARALVDAGVAIALATDLGPASGPCDSLPLVMALACHRLGLTPAEALVACTANGAHVLGSADRCGRLAPGLAADVVVLETPDWRLLGRRLGAPPIRYLFVDGALRVGEEPE